MTLFNVFSLLGGLALFLFGMDIMGKALEKQAGGHLQKILSKLTDNPIKGFFLGLGVTAPTAEWGVMINDARQYIWTQPLQMFWPGLALFISVMAFNLVGDALRDHLDPHLVTEHAH